MADSVAFQRLRDLAEVVARIRRRVETLEAAPPSSGGGGGGGPVAWGDITGSLSSQTDLNSALSGKAPSLHSHVISDVTGLQTALDGKALASHTHGIANVTGLQAALDSKVDDGQISAFGGTLIDDADAPAARSTLGLGSIATQAASSVAITGGTISGITDLAIADGGTGASTAGAALTNLGVSAFAQTLLDDPDATTARSTLGLGSAATLTTSDIDERARDALGTALTAGSGITITPNDGADTITISASGGGGSADEVFGTALSPAMRVKVATSTTGSGTTPLALGAADTGFQTMSAASAIDGQAYSYIIKDGNDWEVQRGVYTASGPTLARGTPIASSNGGSRITLTGSAKVFVTPNADEIYTQPPIVSGEYLALFGSAAQRAANAQTGKSYFLPFRIWRKITIQSLLMRVGTPGVSGAQCALTIYRTVANTYPVGAPLNAGTGFSVSTALINTGYTGLNLPLMPGIYWLGFQTSNATVDYFILDGGASSFANFAHRFAFTGGNDDTNAIVSQQPTLTRNDTFGSWPTLTGAASDFSGTSYAYLMPGTVVRAA